MSGGAGLAVWAADVGVALVGVEEVGERVGEVGQVAGVDAAGVELGGEFAQQCGPFAVPRRAVALDRYAGPDISPLNAAELAAWALGDPDQADGLGPDDVFVGKF